MSFNPPNLVSSPLVELKAFNHFNLARKYRPRFLSRKINHTRSIHSDLPRTSVQHQAPVVQRLDNAIHRINQYPADSMVCFVLINLSTGQLFIRWILLSSLWTTGACYLQPHYIVNYTVSFNSTWPGLSPPVESTPFNLELARKYRRRLLSVKFNHTRSIHSDSFFCFFLWKRKKTDFKEIVALNTKSVKNLLFTTVLHCKRTLRITAPGLGVPRVELPLINLN